MSDDEEDRWEQFDDLLWKLQRIQSDLHTAGLLAAVAPAPFIAGMIGAAYLILGDIIESMEQKKSDPKPEEPS